MTTNSGLDGSPGGDTIFTRKWVVVATGGVWVLALLLNLVSFMRTGRASTLVVVVFLAWLLATARMFVTHRVVKRVLTVCGVVVATAALMLALWGIR